MRRHLAVLFVPLLVAAFTACSSSAKTSSPANATTTTVAGGIPEVTVTAADYGFSIPATIPSGEVKITLKNVGSDPAGHQIQFVKLGSLPYDEFKTKMANIDLKGLPADTIFVGGPNIVDPGKSASAIINLPPGEYGVTCFVVKDKAGPHAKLGMVARTTAIPGAGSSQPVVKSSGTITLTDFAFTFPKPFNGNGTYEVKSSGTQVHELALFRVLTDKPFDQVKQYIYSAVQTGPPLAEPVPGLTGLSKGQSAFVDFHLAPGRYAAFCFFPDLKKGDLPHAIADNMVTEFQVT